MPSVVSIAVNVADIAEVQSLIAAVLDVLFETKRAGVMHSYDETFARLDAAYAVLYRKGIVGRLRMDAAAPE